MSAPSTPEEDGLPKEFLVVDAWSGDDSSSSSQKKKGRHKSRQILSRNRSPENLAISHRKPTEVEIDEFVETLKLANTSDDNGRDNNYNKNLRTDSYNRSSSRRDSRHEDRRRRRSKDERSKRSESSYSRSSYRCRKETKFSSSDRCENVSYKRGVIKKTIFNSRESDVREDRGDYGDRHKILEPSRDRLVFITSDEDNGECVEKNINSFAKEELDYGNRYISEDLRYSILSSRGDNSFSDADIRDDDEYPVDFGDTYEFISESQSREVFVHSRSRSRSRNRENFCVNESDLQRKHTGSRSDLRYRDNSSRSHSRGGRDYSVRYRSRSPKERNRSPRKYSPKSYTREPEKQRTYNNHLSDCGSNQFAHQFNARQAYYTQPHYTDYNQCDDAYIGQPPMVMPPSSNVDFYPGVTSGYFPVPHPTPPPPATPSPPPPPKLTDRERTPPPYWESYKTPGGEVNERSDVGIISGRTSRSMCELLQNKSISSSHLLESSIEPGGTEIPLQLKNDIIAKCELKITQLYHKRIGGFGCFVPDPIPKKSMVNRSPIGFWNRLCLNFNKLPQEKVWRYSTSDNAFHLLPGFKPEKSCYVDYTPYENDPVLAENSRTNIVTPTNSLVVNINDSASVPTKNDTCEFNQSGGSKHTSLNADNNENSRYVAPVEASPTACTHPDFNNPSVINQQSSATWYPSNCSQFSNCVLSGSFQNPSDPSSAYSIPASGMPKKSNNIKRNPRRHLITVPTRSDSM